MPAAGTLVGGQCQTSLPRIEEVFGTFKAVQKQHFDDDAQFDQLMGELKSH